MVYGAIPVPVPVRVGIGHPAALPTEPVRTPTGKSTWQPASIHPPFAVIIEKDDFGVALVEKDEGEGRRGEEGGAQVEGAPPRGRERGGRRPGREVAVAVHRSCAFDPEGVRRRGGGTLAFLQLS